jgi:hypothetical protein
MDGLEQGVQMDAKQTRSHGIADVAGGHSIPTTLTHIVVLAVLRRSRRVPGADGQEAVSMTAPATSAMAIRRTVMKPWETITARSPTSSSPFVVRRFAKGSGWTVWMTVENDAHPSSPLPFAGSVDRRSGAGRPARG